MTVQTQTDTLEWLSSIVRITGLAIFLTLISHLAADPAQTLKTLPGHGLIFIIVMIGFLLGRFIPSKLPDLFWVSMVATTAGFPGIPGSDWFVTQISELSFTAAITPVLAFASLGLRKADVTTFKANGLQIAAIAVFVFLGTFIGSALIAQLTLTAIGA